MKNKHLDYFAFMLALLVALCWGVSAAAGERGLSRTPLVKTAYTTSIHQGTYRAIVIGNNDYHDPKKVWRPLKTAINDAKEFAKVLRQDYGFKDVVLLNNATRQQILKAINKLEARTKPDDSVIIYYAGHGWRNEKTQEAYWIPVDAEGKDDSFYLSNVRIKEKLSVIASTSAHTLLISDSCFSGSLLDARGVRDLPDSSDNRAYYQKVSSRRSVQILAAGGKEFVDDNYRRSGHSPFTYFLINELKRNDQRYLTLNSLALKIEELVGKNAQQTPQSGAIRMAGDEGGQFVFIKVNFNNPAQPLLADPAPAATPNIAAQALPNKAQQQRILAMLKAQDANDAIEELFEKASRDISKQRYSLPKGDSALDRYLTILVLDANNRRAKQAIARLFQQATQTVKRHIHEHQLRQAKKYLFQAERIDPDNEDHIQAVNDLRNQIDMAQQANPNQVDSGITVTRD